MLSHGQKELIELLRNKTLMKERHRVISDLGCILEQLRLVKIVED